MKKLLICLVLIGFAFLSGCSMSKMMFLEDESAYDYEETIERFKAALEDNGWDVSDPIDMQAHYAESDLTTTKMSTLEICLPEKAVKILEEDKKTRMLPMMPMRVAVYEKSDGNIYISRMKMGMMKKMAKGTVKDVMKNGAKALEASAAEVIKD